MKQFLSLLAFGFCLLNLQAQNVGIGTTAPLQKLHVDGNTYIKDSLSIGIDSAKARLDVKGSTLLRGGNTNPFTVPLVAGTEFFVGRANNGALPAGLTNADIAFNWGGTGGGFRHFISTRHHNVASSSVNAIDFYLNNSVAAGSSSAPGTGSILGMSVTANGVSIGTTTPSNPLHVVSANNIGTAYFVNSHFQGDGVLGINNATTGFSGNGAGVVGLTPQLYGAGVWGENQNPDGTGIIGVGGTGVAYPAGGTGGALSGIITGLYSRSTTGGVGQAIYAEQLSDVVRVAYWNGITFFKINGAGTVSTIVSGLNSEKITMYAPETPEIFFQDYGSGKLVNGRAHINIDPVFAKNVTINDKHPLRVFVQLEGDCKGVYVTNKTSTGFDVVELNGGTSNVSFQWTITCNRADEVLSNGRISRNADMRFEPAAEPLPVIKQESRLIDKRKQQPESN